jgi:hypothetical protein
MPARPITHADAAVIAKDCADRRAREATIRKQSAAGLDALKEAAILSAQGDVEAADALRTFLKSRAACDPDEAFVRIVRSTKRVMDLYRLQARAFGKALEPGTPVVDSEFATRDYPTEPEMPPHPVPRESNANQPTGTSQRGMPKRQARDGAGKFRRTMITHLGASLFR